MREAEDIALFQRLREDLLPSSYEVSAGLKYNVEEAQKIISSDDLNRNRELSTYFYAVSGIYKRIIWLFSTMFNFHYMLIPHTLKGYPQQKMLSHFQNGLEFLDGLHLKNLLQEITFYVFKEGAYYGYLRDDLDTPVIQQLPFNYCKANYKHEGQYVVQFNLQYFDREFFSTEDRQTVLKQFPKEIRAFYNRYKQGTLNVDKQNREWVFLDTERAFAFKFPDGKPFFASAIVDLIELRMYKNLEFNKDKLALFALLVQKMPMNKDGEMIFDVTEARELHRNAVHMLQKNQEVDVLTTFADIDMHNLQETRQNARDNLQKAERSVYNETGVSRMLFATEGNLSLQQSIKTNEALVRYIVEMYSMWLTKVVNVVVGKNKKYAFEVFLPPVTIFNEDEMEDKYRQQATLGYSKLLPGIVGGLKQSSLLNLLDFENNILGLNDMMEPLRSTHTQSPDKTGAPEKDDDDKDDNTISNIEGE